MPYLIESPLDQFTIRNLFSFKADLLGNIQISLTNIGLYLIITTIIIYIMYILTTNYNIVTPNNWLISTESIYATVFSTVINQINAKKGQMFFPLISAFLLCIFLYIFKTFLTNYVYLGIINLHIAIVISCFLSVIILSFNYKKYTNLNLHLYKLIYIPLILIYIFIFDWELAFLFLWISPIIDSYILKMESLNPGNPGGGGSQSGGGPPNTGQNPNNDPNLIGSNNQDVHRRRRSTVPRFEEYSNNDQNAITQGFDAYATTPTGLPFPNDTFLISSNINPLKKFTAINYRYNTLKPIYDTLSPEQKLYWYAKAFKKWDSDWKNLTGSEAAILKIVYSENLHLISAENKPLLKGLGNNQNIDMSNGILSALRNKNKGLRKDGWCVYLHKKHPNFEVIPNYDMANDELSGYARGDRFLRQTE